MRILRLLHALLREVFDESAYERFCRREGFPRGRESYAMFVRQVDKGSGKMRCC